MKTYEIQVRTLLEQPTAVIRGTVSMAEISTWLGEAYDKVARVLTQNGTAPAGAPFSRFHQIDDYHFSIEAGFPISAAIEASAEVHQSSLPGGLVAMTVHEGPYDQIEPVYLALTAWVKDHGGELTGDPWEVYYTDPAQQPDPAAWRTEVVQPYRPS